MVTFSAESFSNPLPPAHEEYIDQDEDDYERYELTEYFEDECDSCGLMEMVHVLTHYNTYEKQSAYLLLR